MATTLQLFNLKIWIDIPTTDRSIGFAVTVTEKRDIFELVLVDAPLKSSESASSLHAASRAIMIFVALSFWNMIMISPLNEFLGCLLFLVLCTRITIR